MSYFILFSKIPLRNPLLYEQASQLYYEICCKDCYYKDRKKCDGITEENILNINVLLKNRCVFREYEIPPIRLKAIYSKRLVLNVDLLDDDVRFKIKNFVSNN